MLQLICHLIGDYWLQTDWMALNKKNNFLIALVHGFVYTLPFLVLTRSILALSIIWLSHALIDGTDIVCFLNRLKNNHFQKHFLYKATELGSFDVVPMNDGYRRDRPIWLRVWLIIIQDNTLHLLFNFLAIKYF